ncbi:MAG TPA: LysM peptidoglycan-binding domain-containing protein [Bacteroidales bacterium]|nr:LysM peptidoglycan-binding domain-containing protein [Bacteroidales bacterium]
MRYILQRILILAVTLLFLLQGSAMSQVVVEKSTEKVVILGKSYFIHTVRKGETAYSISKAYGIKVDDLYSENPGASSGLKEGQSLHIPVISVPPVTKPVPEDRKPYTGKPAAETGKDESKFIYHKLSAGDTFFSLAKKYGVSEDDILQGNPGVDIDKLPVGSEVAIPRRQFTTTSKNLETQDRDYISYKVSKGESITSIAEKFGITVKELRKENKGVIFPKVDDYLRIPVQKKSPEPVAVQPVKDTILAAVEEPEVKNRKPEGITHFTSLKGKFNIAFLLPLWFDENAQRFEIDSAQILKGKHVRRITERPDEWIFPESMTFLELFQGALIAADTLRSMGLDINISVFDIKVDTLESVELINSGKLDNMDLIVGPVYKENLSVISEYAAKKNIPVISPVPPKSVDLLEKRPNLFMIFPSLDVAQKAIAMNVGQYPGDNFVFIHCDTAGVDPSVGKFKSLIFKELTKKIPYEDIRFKEFIFYSKSTLAKDSINRLEHTLSENTENTILIASEDVPVLSETIMDLHTLSKKYPIRVVGYPAMRDIDNLEPKYYFELGIELYSPYWIDYGREDVKKFILAYRNKFLSEPSQTSFAWQGYDMTYYFLSGLAIHGKKFLGEPGMHNPLLLGSEYDFERQSPDSGFSNNKLYLVKFTDEMDVKKVEEKPAEGKEN